MEMQYTAIAKYLAHTAVNLAEKKLTCILLVQEKIHQYTLESRGWSCEYVLLMISK